MAIDIAAYVYYGRPALTASYYDGYGFLEALCPDGMAVIPDTLCVRGLATGSVSTVGGGGQGDTAGLRCPREAWRSRRPSTVEGLWWRRPPTPSMAVWGAGR